MLLLHRDTRRLGETRPDQFLYPDRVDESFRVDLLKYSIGQLLKVVRDPGNFSEEEALLLLQDLAAIGSLDMEMTNRWVMALMRLVDEAIQRTGKVRVRYVGDLKPSEYGLDASFFHLGSNATDEDLKKIVFGKLKEGARSATLINLSNVRDIEISYGGLPEGVMNLEKEVRFIQDVAVLVDDWRANGYGLARKDG